MVEERLHYLPILSIENSIMKLLSNEEVLKDYASKKNYEK